MTSSMLMGVTTVIGSSCCNFALALNSVTKERLNLVRNAFYKDQPFGLLPYYDESHNALKFPRYSDQPTNPLADALDSKLTGADGEINVKFETWLVCTISKVLGDAPSQTQDDTYKLAPLLGWSWGYSSQDTGQLQNGGEIIATTIALLKTLRLGV